MSDEDGSGGNGRFSHESPRPPVPGGEEVEPPFHPALSSSAGPLATASSASTQLSSLTSFWRNSPNLTPRQSNLRHHSPQPNDSAPLGFEPEGADNVGGGCVGDGSSGGSSGEGLSPPACLRWACNLHSLLNDSEGVDLFTKYLQQEGQVHADTLNFLFACKGLKKQNDPKRVSSLVKVIYKHYFIKSQLTIREELRREVTQRIKDREHLGPNSSTIFNDVQTEVEKLINDTTYPEFLQSDLYLEYIQSVQFNGEVISTSATTSSSSSSGGLGNSGNEGNRCSLLQTVHEDVELETPNETLPRRRSVPHSTSAPSCSSTQLTLTKDMLMATQTKRAMECRPRTEAYAENFLSRGCARPLYSAYNPVSRQDSELQSLSSGARTESDNMSLTDSSLDGTSSRYRPSQKHSQRQNREYMRNREDPKVLPRTFKLQKKDYMPIPPEKFATELIGRLEKVIHDQEKDDKINRMKRHAEEEFLEDSRSIPVGSQSDCLLQPKTIADAIKNKLVVNEDNNNQAILDDHVSRVWDDSPSRSPRPRSPEGRHRGPTKPSFHFPSRHPKKEKDIFSILSSDSGNGRDMPEGSLPKSRSMPDYSHPPLSSGILTSGNKRVQLEPLTEDSGVSVVSASTASGHHKERIRLWLSQHENTSTNSKHSRNKPNISANSRSDSDKCGGHPIHPFVTDPSMPPIGSPHTHDQLEEARRRLLEDERGKISRGRMSSGKPIVDPTINISGQSTLRKSGRRAPVPSGMQYPAQDSTIAVFNFCEETLPYLSKIPGRAITLRQFKECLPKKGVYRFFFKAECDDLDIGVIQEEITDDNVVLPLWEGKIMAQVKLVD